MHFCMCEYSVMSHSLRPHGLASCDLLSMEFSRQEYWTGLLFPTPSDLPATRIKLVSPSWQADSLPLSHLGSPFEMQSSLFWLSTVYQIFCVSKRLLSLVVWYAVSWRAWFLYTFTRAFSIFVSLSLFMCLSLLPPSLSLVVSSEIKSLLSSTLFWLP